MVTQFYLLREKLEKVVSFRLSSKLVLFFLVIPLLMHCLDPRRFRLIHETSFGKKHLRFWSEHRLLRWPVSTDL